MENLVKQEKRKHTELEKKMAKAQLPTSEATSLKVYDELATQLPSKNSRLHEQKEKQDERILVIPNKQSGGLKCKGQSFPNKFQIGEERTQQPDKKQKYFSLHK